MPASFSFGVWLWGSTTLNSRCGGKGRSSVVVAAVVVAVTGSAALAAVAVAAEALADAVVALAVATGLTGVRTLGAGFAKSQKSMPRVVRDAGTLTGTTDRNMRCWSVEKRCICYFRACGVHQFYCTPLINIKGVLNERVLQAVQTCAAATRS